MGIRPSDYTTAINTAAAPPHTSTALLQTATRAANCRFGPTAVRPALTTTLVAVVSRTAIVAVVPVIAPPR